MEEQLRQVRELKHLQQQQPLKASDSGSMWRSATDKQQIRGYDKALMSHVDKTKDKPPRLQAKQARQPSPQTFVPGLKEEAKSESKIQKVEAPETLEFLNSISM